MSKVQEATKTLDYCVHSVMADLEETSTKNYQKYLKWGFDAFRELNLFNLPQVKTTYITMENNKTIELPDDYVDYTAIGIVVNGNIWLLGLNDSMSLNRTQECVTDIQSVPTVPVVGLPYSYYFSGGFRNGQYVGEMYSYGGGWSSRGYYRVDLEKNRIQFSSVVPGSEILLEYKSTGVNCDGTVAIPNQAITAIVAYIHWQRVLNDEKVKRSAAEIANRERLWNNAFNELKHFNLMFTMREYLDSKYRTIKQTPKR